MTPNGLSSFHEAASSSLNISPVKSAVTLLKSPTPDNELSLEKGLNMLEPLDLTNISQAENKIARMANTIIKILFVFLSLEIVIK